MTEIDILKNILPDFENFTFEKDFNDSENAKKSSYHITIKEGIIKDIQLFLKLSITKEKIMIISDELISDIYSEDIKKRLVNAGFEVYLWKFKKGEKNIDNLSSFLKFLSDCDFKKSDIVLSVGGGSTCDLSSLAASMYMGGIRFIFLPTNLLAACNSCITGRSYVNLSGKNKYCSGIYFPMAVYIDTEVIKRSGKDNLEQGMIELIRSAIMGGEEDFEFLENFDVTANIEEAIFKCLDIKNKILEQKNKPTNESYVLDLANIFYRAVENVGDEVHSKALATGLYMTLKASLAKGFCDKSTFDRIVLQLNKYNLIIKDKFTFSEIKNAILLESKNTKGHINFVVPFSIGDCRLVKVELKDLDDWVRVAVDE